MFLAGNELMTKDIEDNSNNFLNKNGNINIVALQEYLRKTFPGWYYTEELSVGDPGFRSPLGISILSIRKGKTIIKAMKQSLNYEIKTINTPTTGTNMVTDGIDSIQIYEKIMEYNKARYERTGKDNIVEDVFDTYRNNYSEGVGGEIFMYSLSEDGLKMIQKEVLKETGLKCLNKGENVLPDGQILKIHINGYTPIHAGNIGSQSVNSAKVSEYATSSLDAAYSYGLMSTGSSPVGATVYVSINGNLRPYTSGLSSCGSSEGKWRDVWAVNGTIQTSDEREKTEIEQ